jgi:hypothetical protein
VTSPERDPQDDPQDESTLTIRARPWLETPLVRIGLALFALHLALRLVHMVLGDTALSPRALTFPFVSLVGSFLLSLLDRQLLDGRAPLRVLGRELDPRHRPIVWRSVRPTLLRLAVLLPGFCLLADARGLIAGATSPAGGDELFVPLMSVVGALMFMMLLIACQVLALVWRLQRLLKTLPD